jgi:transposase-like protein
MPQQSATVINLEEGFGIIKEMHSQGFEFGEDYRVYGRQALKAVMEEKMVTSIDRYLFDVGRRLPEPDRKNGYYERHLLTELGDIELKVPRTRRYSALNVVRSYERRAGHIDRMILACFVLGLSTRKIGEALLPILGERVSPSLVSRIGKRLDSVVRAFHQRSIKSSYRVLLLDGVVLSRKTGAGALKRPVLVALGITGEGKKEVIDFRLAPGESEKAWETFLTDLYKRGLTEDCFELLGVDGGKGCLSAIETVFPQKPLQRCWAHKNRNILGKVKEQDWETVKQDLHKIMYAKNLVKARSAARRFADNWKTKYPKAVKCLRDDLDQLLTVFMVFKNPKWRKAARTTNAIERRFREVKRRTRPMGVFSDRASIDRILFSVFSYENKHQGINTPFLMTQIS